MKRHNDLPAGWRQPPETTAEPVPLRRPYVPPGEVFPPEYLMPPPPPRSQLLPRRRPAFPGRTPAGATPPAPPAPRPAAPPPAMRRWRPMRAIIGDEFRIPVLWCEFGSCIGRYTSQDALGERDLRARALAAGWCHDALGRLACPSCVQHDPAFLVHRPPAWADRDPWRR
jgi:hypothetical protein